MATLTVKSRTVRLDDMGGGLYQVPGGIEAPNGARLNFRGDDGRQRGVTLVWGATVRAVRVSPAGFPVEVTTDKGPVRFN